MKQMFGVKKVFLVGFWPDYEEFFFKDLSIDGLSFKTINPLIIVDKNVFSKNLPRYFKNMCFKRVISDLIKDNEESIFIFQEHRLILEMLLDKNYPCNAHILLRNSVRSNPRTVDYINKFKQQNYTVWSFDGFDCNQYNLKRYKQMIRSYPEFNSTPTVFDFSFVGRDKGREYFLEKLKTDLESKGFTMNINIRGKSKKDSICYKEYLSELCQANCIVDIVQDQQSGLTLRPLEAMIYKRKLITNNDSVRESSFYHPNNVFMLTDNYDLENIVEFMQRPFIDISKRVKDEYLANNVFRTIIKSIESNPVFARE